MADNATDSGSTGPFPRQEQSRHMYYKIRGGDSRDYWYDKELRVSKRLLRRNKCEEAAMALGRALHSRQDRSAHRKWPDWLGGGDWHAWITHPSWWDYYGNGVVSGSIALSHRNIWPYRDSWWHDRSVEHREEKSDYDWWVVGAQYQSQNDAIQTMTSDTKSAMTSMASHVHTYGVCCRDVMLINQSSSDTAN